MEKQINELTREDLLNPDFIPSLYDNYDEKEIGGVLNEVMVAAREHRITGKIKTNIDKYKKELKLTNNNIISFLDFSEKGVIKATTTNYEKVMNNDPYIKNLFYYDAFAEKIINGKTGAAWSNADDSRLRCYIEDNYDFFDANKYYDAFIDVVMSRSVHPIKNIIEMEPWDGKPRIDSFLKKIMFCEEDDDYLREVSRMIFYGGISRLYNPGCKFDYMPIFVGKQGTYKSTMIRWLALDDKYFNDITTIEGKDGMETLQGHWICEMAELLAMVRTKEVEAMKSYITRTIDKFRPAFGRRSEEHPRQCIFIGTTNDKEFLSDKTGNRRYLPVTIGLNPGDFLNMEKSIKSYILQCWREALYLYKNKKTYLTIPFEYYDKVTEMQEKTIEDDPMENAVLEYLSKKEIGDYVCNLELYTNCGSGIKKNYTKAVGKVYTQILNDLPNWRRLEGTKYVKDYGKQRVWEKIVPVAKKKNVIQLDDWSDLD